MSVNERFPVFNSSRYILADILSILIGGLYYEIITTTDRPIRLTHLVLFGDDSRAHDDAAQQYVGLQ